MPETTGERIRTARQDAGLSMRLLAELALGNEKSARLIAYWEAGEVQPTIASLQKIAPYLCVSVAELIPDSTIEITETAQASV